MASGGLFGSSSPSPFGSTPSPSLFGQTPAFGQSSTPAFGQSTTPAFGQSSAATTTTSLFGQPSTPSLFSQQAPGTSAFGQAASTPSLFGSSTPAFGQSGAATPSLFGQPASSPSLFGNSTAQQTPSLFGATAAQQTPSLFGQPSSAFGAGTSASLFGASASQPSLFASSTPSLFGGASTPALGFGAAPAATPGLGLGFHQQQLQQQQQLQLAALPTPSPERDLQQLAERFFGGGPAGPTPPLLSHAFLSVTQPVARVPPPGVNALMWQDALQKLEAMGAEGEGLWPEVVTGFSGLANRLQVQDATIASDQQRVASLEASICQLAAHLDAMAATRLASVRQKQQLLQQKLLRITHLAEVMELRCFPRLPLSPAELQCREQLAAVAHLLQPAASDFPRLVDSLVTRARVLPGEGGEAEGGRAGGGNGRAGGGAARIGREAMEELQRLVAVQSEAVAKLASVVAKDSRDLDVMAGRQGQQKEGRGVPI